MAESDRKRESFNTVVDWYDRYRRGYPAEVIEQIVQAAQIGTGSHALEIGCGTGQLTRPLLERGITVTAVELGEALAERARRNLAQFSGVHIDVSSFETWAMPQERFDAVLRATAFHWLDPKVRAAKSGRALKSGGRLVAVYPHHINEENNEFVRDSQTYYLKWGLSPDPDWRPPTADEVAPMYTDIDECPAFSRVDRLRILKTVHFTTDEYVGLLHTDSLVLTLSPPKREGFLADIATLIDSRYGGKIARDYLYEMVVAQKTSGS